jgi:moderate conductance mechanosensitive channel
VRFAFGLTSVAVFALGSIGAFLAFEWPPLLKQIVLAYLVAALAWRVALLFGRLLLEPRFADDEEAPRYRLVPMPDEAAAFWHMRLGLFAGWFAFGWATCEVLVTLGFSKDAQSLVAFTLGLGLLVLAIEALWRRPRLHPAASRGARLASHRLSRRDLAFVGSWTLGPVRDRDRGARAAGRLLGHEPLGLAFPAAGE